MNKTEILDLMQSLQCTGSPELMEGFYAAKSCFVALVRGKLDIPLMSDNELLNSYIADNAKLRRELQDLKAKKLDLASKIAVEAQRNTKHGSYRNGLETALEMLYMVFRANPEEPKSVWRGDQYWRSLAG